MTERDYYARFNKSMMLLSSIQEIGLAFMPCERNLQPSEIGSKRILLTPDIK